MPPERPCGASDESDVRPPAEVLRQPGVLGQPGVLRQAEVLRQAVLHPKRSLTTQTAMNMAAMSAVRPAGTACRVFRMFTAPK